MNPSGISSTPRLQVRTSSSSGSVRPDTGEEAAFGWLAFEATSVCERRIHSSRPGHTVLAGTLEVVGSQSLRDARLL